MEIICDCLFCRIMIHGENPIPPFEVDGIVYDLKARLELAGEDDGMNSLRQMFQLIDDEPDCACIDEGESKGRCYGNDDHFRWKSGIGVLRFNND